MDVAEPAFVLAHAFTTWHETDGRLVANAAATPFFLWCNWICSDVLAIVWNRLVFIDFVWF